MLEFIVLTGRSISAFKTFFKAFPRKRRCSRKIVSFYFMRICIFEMIVIGCARFCYLTNC